MGVLEGYLVTYRRFDAEKTKACLTEVGNFCRSVRSNKSGTTPLPLDLAEYTDALFAALKEVRKHGYSPPEEEIEPATRVYDLSRYRHIPPYAPPFRPSCFHISEYSVSCITEAVKRSVKSIRAKREEGPNRAEYPLLVPFGIEEGSMSEACIEYYVFWAENADAGRYYDMDRDYLQAYFLEALMAGPEASEVRELCAKPVFGSAGGHIHEMYAEYLMLRDEPVPFPFSYPASRQYALRRFLERGPGAMGRYDSDGVLDELGYSRRFKFREPPKNYVILLLNLFRRIYSDCPGGMPGLQNGTVSVRYLQEAIELAGPAYVRVCTVSEDFSKEFRYMAQDVEYFYQRYVEDGYLRKMPVKYFGVNIVPHMNRLLDRIFHPPAKVEVDIDTEAVRAAQDDLDYVVGVIASEQDPPETVSPEEKPAEPPSESPWDSLKGLLSEECLGYLRKCLSGTAAVNRLEDEINAAALDSVGDTVVEGGSIVEDYREDVLRMLG